MNYKRAEVNGISCNATTGVSKEAWAELEERAASLREDAREIISHKSGNFHYGSRFTSNNAIAQRAISGIRTAGHSLTTLSAELMDEYIIAAFIDAASADHWYTFEKQWE